MKRYLPAMAAAAFLAPAASAFTVDEIVNACPYMIAEAYQQVSNVTNARNTILHSFAIKLEKVDDTHLMFHYFENRYDFVFTLTDDAGNETSNGTRLSISGKAGIKYANTNYATQTDNKYFYIVNCTTNPNYWYNNHFTRNRDNNYDLGISQDENGEISIHSLEENISNNIGYYIYSSGGPLDCSGITLNLKLYPFEHYMAQNPDFSEGFATDRYDDFIYNKGAYSSATNPANTKRVRSENRGYPMLVNWNTSSNTFQMTNFGNLGLATSVYGPLNKHGQYYSTTQTYVTGTFTDDGTCTIDLPEGGFFSRFEQQGTNVPYWLGFYITNFDATKGATESSAVKGTWKAVDEPAHNSWGNGWVTNGGARRTFQGMEAKFNTYTLLTPLYTTSWSGRSITPINYVNSPYFNMTFEGGYFNTDILFGANVTVDVDLNLDVWGKTDKVFAIRGSIHTNANDKYVDHYELMAVEGKYESINDAGFNPHADLGHNKAVCIHTFELGELGRNLHNGQEVNADAAEATALADESEETSTTGAHDYTFIKDIPYEHLSGFSHNVNDPVTLFIKTVYTPESGLTPTFHSMVNTALKLPTAVEAIHADADSENAPVEYYNLQGIRVQNPAAGQIYIRRQGSKASKIRF